MSFRFLDKLQRYNDEAVANFYFLFLIMKKYLLPIEGLHLMTWYVLIISGIGAYFTEWLGMFLSWWIFGCMYISMSDIWENSKSIEEKQWLLHKNRRFTAYAGLIFSVILLWYYVFQMINL